MSPEAQEILRKRAEAHTAACQGIDDDPLIKAAFGKQTERPPIQTPTQPGFLLRKQAD